MKPDHLKSRLISPGYQAPAPFGSLTTPIHHASTVTFANVAALRARSWLNEDGYTYGLHGTPTTYELQHRLADLEGGSYALLAPSGLAAIAMVNLALLKSGDELLVPDNGYAPNRELSEKMLSGFGIACKSYDAGDVEGTSRLIGPNTRLMWIEAPGSVTMEVPDVSRLAALARERGVLTALDNTWSGGIFLKGFEHGLDIVMNALTKYPSGGSDVLMGSVVTRDLELHRKIKIAHMRLGLGVAGDDAYLVLRGLSSLHARLDAHQASGYQIASWLALRPEIERVLHPGLPSCPGHEFWKRDFSGAGGLFSVVFNSEVEDQRIDAMIDALKLFSIGYSWGGSHSLAVPYQLQGARKVRPWVSGTLVRFYVGLEDANDLLADLAQAFKALE
jgi:cysteine-S-conjugate beta-lyase